MTLKKYQQIKLVLVMVIAIIFSQSIVLKNFIIPTITLIISSLTLMILRNKVKEVVADERDYELAGKSARWSIQIYSWVAVLAIFILYAFKDTNPSYEPIAVTLAYSTCLLMIINGLFFKFQSKIKFTKNKPKFLILLIILAMFLSVFTLRLFSGEDNWVCKNGQWIKHGNPNFSIPTIPCK